jgi:hypothetical protein
MRLLHALLLFPLFSVPVLAETAPPPAADHHGRRTAEEHFAEANTTHDGRLTLDQAKTGYKSIAKSFELIDIGRRGYITMNDIKAWKAAKKAARAALKQAAQSAYGASGGGFIRPDPAVLRGEPPRATDASSDSIAPAPRVGVDLPKAPLDVPRPS